MTISQATFDRVASHLLTQNEKSIGGGTCLYRGPEGRMCAVGCLIEDKHYSAQLEQQYASDSIVITALVRSGVDYDEVEDLAHLQYIHDEVPVENWKIQLKQFALQSNLEWRHG